MKKLFSYYEIAPVALIIFSALVGFLVYPSLPHQIPSHWNARGIVDDWMNKNLAVLFFPVLTLAVYLLMTFIPFADPYKKNYLKFARHYFLFRAITVLFLVLIYFFTLWYAMGLKANIVYFIIPMLSIFIIYTGFFMTKVKRNYFVGIRTPWTIHSEKVWDKTHEFGGKVVVIAGILSLISIISVKYSFIIFISIILIAFSIPVVYSYILFKKEKDKK